MFKGGDNMASRELRKHSNNPDQDLHDDFIELDKMELEEEKAKSKLDFDTKREKMDHIHVPGNRSTILKP